MLSTGTLSDWCGRNVDAPGIRLRSLFTMSVAMRSDVNGLMAATVAGVFFNSDDGVDAELGHDGVEDADDGEPLLLQLLALRSSGWSSCCWW